MLINQGLSGERHIQDVSTINSGRFVMDFVETQNNVLVGDLSFYPGRRINTYRISSIPDEKVDFNDIDVVIDSSKLMNRMRYYGIQFDNVYFSRTYDNGNSQLLIRDI
jgi:hypothetical protein